MKSLFKTIFLFLSLTLIQCSSDDDSSASALMMNGAEFKLGNNSGENVYNTIKSEGESGIWFSIRENAENGRVISIYANHEAGRRNATYALDNDMIEPGFAIVAIMNEDESQQISGGSDFSPPMGTITIKDLGNHRLKVTFNDVVLDSGAASETTISGSCTKKFTMAFTD